MQPSKSGENKRIVECPPLVERPAPWSVDSRCPTSTRSGARFGLHTTGTRHHLPTFNRLHTSKIRKHDRERPRSPVPIVSQVAANQPAHHPTPLPSSGPLDAYGSVRTTRDPAPRRRHRVYRHVAPGASLHQLAYLDEPHDTSRQPLDPVGPRPRRVYTTRAHNLGRAGSYSLATRL